MDISKPTQYLITYRSYVSQLMEPPYKTTCREYALNQSRDECFASCVRETTIQRYKRIPASCNVFMGNQNLTIFDERVFEEEKKTEEFPGGYTSIRQSIEANFYNLCRRIECKSVVHIPSSSDTLFQKKSVWNLIFSKNPVITTSTQATTSLTTFLTNVFSTFGFWLGLSISDSIPITVNFIKAVRELLHRKIQEKQERVRKTTVVVSLFVREPEVQGFRSNAWFTHHESHRHKTQGDYSNG